MKKVIIIDDEPLARSILAEYLNDLTGFEIVAQCGNGFEGLKTIAQHTPDLVFLDVQMPKINGFEMLELLPEAPPVIFTTAFDQFAVRAFEANAIDYLLKPFTKERLESALKKWNGKNTSATKETLEKLLQQTAGHSDEKHRIVVRHGNEIRLIPTAEIIYLEAYDDYVKIHTNGQYFLKKKTLNHFESVLDGDRFFRSHRSYLVNLSFLTKIETLEKNSYIAILKNGAKVPLSRTHYADLKLKLNL